MCGLYKLYHYIDYTTKTVKKGIYPTWISLSWIVPGYIRGPAVLFIGSRCSVWPHPLTQDNPTYLLHAQNKLSMHYLCPCLRTCLTYFRIATLKYLHYFNPAVWKTVVNIQCLDCVNIDLTRLRNFHRLYHTSRTCEEGSLQSPPCPCKRRPGSWLSSQDSNNPFSTSKFLRKSHRPEYSIRSIIPWSWWKLNSFSLEKGFPLPKH